uniref:Uncharacterized protein n=1 Tax=Glossina pallidipes TaxID=7398 RepID=A0A1B0A144_GLOPL
MENLKFVAVAVSDVVARDEAISIWRSFSKAKVRSLGILPVDGVLLPSITTLLSRLGGDDSTSPPSSIVSWRAKRNTVTFTLLPCPPLLLEVLLCLAWAVLSRRLSRALKLLETATLALVSLAESTLELPRRRPHLLARVLRADGGPDEGDGEGVGEGAAAVVKMRESSVLYGLVAKKSGIQLEDRLEHRFVNFVFTTNMNYYAID